MHQAPRLAGPDGWRILRPSPYPQAAHRTTGRSDATPAWSGPLAAWTARPSRQQTREPRPAIEVLGDRWVWLGTGMMTWPRRPPGRPFARRAPDLAPARQPPPPFGSDRTGPHRRWRGPMPPW